MNQINAHAPYVLENTPKGERVWDVQSRLFRDRIIMLNTEITRQVASVMVAQLLVLQHENAEAEIQMIINSPGGEVVAGLAIYDMMKLIKCPIKTICTGEACSAASFLLAAGTKGKRFILPHSRVLLHQPWGGVQGQVTDIKIQYTEMQRMKDTIIDILHNDTGKSKNELHQDLERDYILVAEKAVEYGVVDQVWGV